MASVRAFGVIIVAAMDEDFEGRGEAVRWAVTLANALEDWQSMPWRGSDAGHAKVADLCRARAEKGPLDTWDIRCLADLSLKALEFPAEATLASTDGQVVAFNDAVNELERSWAEQELPR